MIITMILVLVQHIDAQAYPKAMNKFLKYISAGSARCAALLVLLSMVLYSCEDENFNYATPFPDDMTEVMPEPKPGRGEWTFKVKVILDKKTFDEKYKSDVNTVKAKLKERFSEINKLYAGVDNTLFFEKDIVFEPVFAASHVYNESSEKIVLSYDRCNEIRGSYPYLVILDGCIGDFGDERWHQDYTLGTATVICPAQEGRNVSPSLQRVYDILGSYQTSEGLAHELGHGRGVLDIYAMEVNAGQNAVNGQGFEGVTCIMNMCWGGRSWSEYAQLIINRNQHYAPQDKEYAHMYVIDLPSTMEVKVTKVGKAVTDGTVNVYTSAFYSLSIDKNVDFTQKLSNGTASFDSWKIYIPTMKGWYVDNGICLVEAVVGDQKGYKFVPLYDLQVTYMKGEKSKHTVTIDLK